MAQEQTQTYKPFGNSQTKPAEVPQEESNSTKVEPVFTPTAPVSNIETPKSKGRFPIKKLLIVVIILIILGGGAIVASQILKNPPGGDVTPSAVEHVAEEFPDFNGIPITENTVSFAKVDNKFCLRYKGHIYVEQDTGSYEPREVESDNPDQYPWYGLVDAPNGLAVENGPGDNLHSFKASPSNKSFVFIMRWTGSEGEKFYMFRFNNNEFSELKTFTKGNNVFYAPKLNAFSLGGNFLNIHLFPCAGCIDQIAETLLYYIPTGEVKNIGQVSYFSWGKDDNAYEYKDYEEGVDPDNLPLRRNEFFEESVDLLLPK